MLIDDLFSGNQFLIYNKAYHPARLTQWGPGCRDVGSYEDALRSDQLWALELHPHRPGCYYIVNEVYSLHRLANHEHDLVVYNGPHCDDQLFRFVSNDEGYYAIQSAQYPGDWVTKLGAGNAQVSFEQSGCGMRDNQLWRIVPRFRAQLFKRELFHLDNRQGCSPVTREISITTGVRRSFSSSITNITSYKRSISAALALAAEVLDLGLHQAIEYENELNRSFSQGNERDWSKTEIITFIVPPRKNFKVVQQGVRFEGQFTADTCTLLTRNKTFESSTSLFEESGSE